ncbi:hypothetical protein [Hymenobacter coccineus]|uniref:hypothetical protein n=1 Tax=Hymenobacter coccineus TaxID=1908235 RepID=UPI000F7B05F8|nr:hypothetical protein [Hymenobacter coccineus]
MKDSFAQLLPASLVIFFLLLASCEHSTHPTEVVEPLSTTLIGRWRYDSTGAAFYNSRREFSNKFMAPLPANALLTIGPTRWNYSGSLHEEHSYTRQGNNLLVYRIGDSHLADLKYIHQEEIGKVIGNPSELTITTLSAHQLVVRDSTMDSDRSLIRVWRSYYSR